MIDAAYQELPPAWEHQAEAVPQLCRGSYALFWEQRTGKTRACAEALRILAGEQEATAVLVLCPVNAKDIWRRAADVFMPHWEQYMCQGLQGQEIPDEVQFIICNPEILKPQVRAAQAFDGWLGSLLRVAANKKLVLIMDEPHLSFVNPTSDRYKAATSLSRVAARVWLCDGTPQEKSGLDYHWQLKMLGDTYPLYWLNRNQFGGRYCHATRNPFRGRQITATGRNGKSYMRAAGGYDYGPFSNPDKFWFDVHLVADRRLRRDCIDVPPTRRLDMWVESLEQPDRVMPACWPRLRQELASFKVQLTVDYVRALLEEGEGPVVVAGHHVGFTEAVANKLHAPIIRGGVTGDTRARICNEFEQGQHDVLVLNIRAGGVAIELARAHHVVFGEIDWTARDLRQVEDRLQGVNQKAPEVLAHYLLVRHSVDEEVWDRVLLKGRGIDDTDQAARALREAQRGMAFEELDG